MRPIVVDANIVFAAFIKDSTTRELILDGGLDLRSPPWLWEDVAERFSWLRQKTGLPRAALDELLRQLRARITDIPAGIIEPHKDEALARVGPRDRKDAPYVAATLAVDGDLWKHDVRLAARAGLPSVTTERLWERGRTS